MDRYIDCAVLTQNWSAVWPDHRPIAHELRGGDRWVRFHSLPGSKRYAESDEESAEILRRHNITIDELVASTPDPNGPLVAVTCSWSLSDEPVARDADLRSILPDAARWQSLLREVDEGDEFWVHLFVSSVTWHRGALDGLLLHVAEDRTSDVILAPADFDWLYCPYDGGADVIASDSNQRDDLLDRHRDWLSRHPEGL